MRLQTLTASLVFLVAMATAASIPAQAREGISLSDGAWVGSVATSTAVGASGESVFVISQSGELSALDAKSGSVVRSVSVSATPGGGVSGAQGMDAPRAVVVHPQTGLVYVPSQTRPLVFVYNPQTLELVDQLLVGTSGFSTAVFGSGNSLYLGSAVASYEGPGRPPGVVLKVDPTDGSVVWSSAALPAAALELEVDERTNQAFFVGHDGVLRQLDLSTSESRVALPSVRQSALGMALDEDSGTLYVAMQSGVHVVSTKTLGVESIWTALPTAKGIALARDSGLAWVASRQELALVHMSTGAIVSRRKVEDIGFGWGFGGYFQSNGRSPTLAFVEGFSTVRIGTFGRLQPSPPRNVRVTSTANAVVVSWRPPLFGGTPALQSYEVRVQGEGIVCQTASTRCRVPASQISDGSKVVVRARLGTPG